MKSHYCKTCTNSTKPTTLAQEKNEELKFIPNRATISFNYKKNDLSIMCNRCKTFYNFEEGELKVNTKSTNKRLLGV